MPSSTAVEPVRAAVIPAAGLGTRFLPASLAVPKELCILCDRPALQWLVDEAIEAGAEEVVIVTSPEKPALERYFRPASGLRAVLERHGRERELALLDRLEAAARRVRFVVQREQRGLGHAVLCAAEAVGARPFLVLLGDAPVLAKESWSRQLVRVRERAGGGCVLALREVPREQTARYGVADIGNGCPDAAFLRIRDLVEKPDPARAPSNLAIGGRYVLEPEVFDLLRSVEPGVGGELQLTDAIRPLCAKGRVFGRVCDGRRFDIGDPMGYLEAAIAFALADPRFRPVVTKAVAEFSGAEEPEVRHGSEGPPRKAE